MKSPSEFYPLSSPPHALITHPIVLPPNSLHLPPNPPTTPLSTPPLSLDWGLTMVREKPNCPPLPPLTIPRSRWSRGAPAAVLDPATNFKIRRSNPNKFGKLRTLDTRYFSLQRSNNPTISFTAFYGISRSSGKSDCWCIFLVITFGICNALLPMYHYKLLGLFGISRLSAQSCSTQHPTFLNF